MGRRTVPVIAALGVSITRDLAAGRMGVDAVALISMTAALILNANLAAVVVAVMYAAELSLRISPWQGRNAISDRSLIALHASRTDGGMMLSRMFR